MRRTTATARVFTAVALAAFLAGAPSAARAQGLSQLFVEALDTRTGAPVTDLQPADFRVEEDGSPGGIVSADISDAPMKIALLVDNGDVLADTNAITLGPAHEVGEFAELGRQLIANAVTIHTVLLSMRGGSEVTSISSNLSQNTGGVFEVINASSGLDESLTALATRMNAHYDRVSTWYRLIYERPDPPGSSVSVRLSSRPGVRFNLFGDRRMQP